MIQMNLKIEDKVSDSSTGYLSLPPSKIDTDQRKKKLMLSIIIIRVPNTNRKVRRCLQICIVCLFPRLVVFVLLSDFVITLMFDLAATALDPKYTDTAESGLGHENIKIRSNVQMTSMQSKFLLSQSRIFSCRAWRVKEFLFTGRSCLLVSNLTRTSKVWDSNSSSKHFR